MDETVCVETLPAHDAGDNEAVGIGPADLVSEDVGAGVTPVDALGVLGAEGSDDVGSLLRGLEGVDLCDGGEEVADVAVQGLFDVGPALGGVDCFEVLDDDRGVGDALGFDAADEELAVGVYFLLRGEDEDDKVGELAGVECGEEVAGRGEPLQLLLEALDAVGSK